MTWVRLDDQFPDHPKVDEAGPEAAWLFVAGLCYCGAKQTDGEIPKGRVARLTALRRPQVFAERLVEAGLWHDKGGHYEVHDYLKYQPSKAKVEAQREAARKRQEKFRGSHAVTEDVTSPSPSDDIPSGAVLPPDNDDPLPEAGSSSWTEAELYAEAGRICARDFTGTFTQGEDAYATGAARRIRRERAHLVPKLRRFPLEQAAEIISRPDAAVALDVDAAFLEEFVPASEIGCPGVSS